MAPLVVFAATLTSAARGGRLEGGREPEVGGELHRARVLRAAVAPLVEGEAGLRRGSDVPISFRPYREFVCGAISSSVIVILR